MALSATVLSFDIDLSDVDRSVYESLSFKVAQQPSETDEYMLTRVLAYCLEYADGIGFSRGIAEPDEPAVSVRDLTGAIQVWIEIGTPDASRLHKASKASRRLVVFTHNDPERLTRAVEGERIHRRESIAVRPVDRALLEGLVARLDRRMKFALSVSHGHAYVTFPDGETIEGEIRTQPL